jgi:hypothetical protein
MKIPKWLRRIWTHMKAIDDWFFPINAHLRELREVIAAQPEVPILTPRPERQDRGLHCDECGAKIHRGDRFVMLRVKHPLCANPRGEKK